MISVEETLSQILEATTALSLERVRLLDSLGRVLAEEIEADICIPPFTNSAVDGYAVIAAETAGAQISSPVYLKDVGEINAGQLAEKTLLTGEAIRIMTGAPVPPGADAIVMIEDTERIDSGRIEIREETTAGRHIRFAGEDVAKGQKILLPGVLIRPAEIAMLATMGRAEVQVHRMPRVAVISTGDEVVEIETGVEPPPGKIRNSNQYALAALVREAGGQISSLTHIPDDLEATEAALRECADADVIVTAGGVSMGDRDFVKPALEKLGSLDLWRVAMKPGKPLAFGRIGKTLFFGLPGNPVSAMVTFELFVRPALWKLAGRQAERLARRTVHATLTHSVSHAPGRQEYVRVATFTQDDQLCCTPTGAQGSGILHSMTFADSLLIIPTESTGIKAGEQVRVMLL